MEIVVLYSVTMAMFAAAAVVRWFRLGTERNRLMITSMLNLLGAIGLQSALSLEPALTALRVVASVLVVFCAFMFGATFSLWVIERKEDLS